MFLFLHPAARLLLWLMLAIFMQLAAFPWLAGIALFCLFAGAKTRRHWWRLLLRTRFLLLTLFLVFAWSVPGESPGGWLPSGEGVMEAALHVLRLILFLGTLAWLLAPLRPNDLMGALWFLLRPCRVLGLPVDKSVVRLSLVLEYMENPPAAREKGEKSSWKTWLEENEEEAESPMPVRISLPLWRGRDTLSLVCAALVLCAGVPG
jgi:energy-coupling factor transporter transmembrane protein EcfT